MKIRVDKFKKIASVEIELAPVNIFIGANNSGKSSFIQAIQFAVSGAQTLEMQRARWVSNDFRVASIDSSDFLYSPTKDIARLYHNGRLRGSSNDGTTEIVVEFQADSHTSTFRLSKGKNRGLTTRIEGMDLGEKLCSLAHPFCVYVPGIAGIPIQEKKEPNIVVKRSATRGDSNNFLRNILLQINSSSEKWNRFEASVSSIYPNTKVVVTFNEDESEFIEVEVETNGLKLPIDSVGTGLLQVIQVFAYLEYFGPQLLLLDEPDSHIHPTKQRLLAHEMLKRSSDERGPIVVFSTHSRYILDALDNNRAKVIHFNNGAASVDVVGSQILLDIGAADADYLFNKRTLKYVIATEDKVDNIEDKKQFLKNFAIANGLSEDQFVLHSYEGCTKVDSALILQSFVQKHIPAAKVLIHYDRDQKEMNETIIQKLQSDCSRLRIPLFITEHSEIENYFCQTDHIARVFGLSEEEKGQYELTLNGFYEELEGETKAKIENFLINMRPDRCHAPNSNRVDVRITRNLTGTIYTNEGLMLTPGKELLGKVKNYVQTVLKKDPNDIIKPSSGLRIQAFQTIIN